MEYIEFLEARSLSETDLFFFAIHFESTVKENITRSILHTALITAEMKSEDSVLRSVFRKWFEKIKESKNLIR